MKLDRKAASPGDVAPTLDRIDRAILRQLQRDASISNVSLAAKVKLSAPACLRRVERLKEMGLIRGIVALLDPKPLGAGMLVVIGFVLDRSTPEAFAAFETAAQEVSGCVECHVVTGEFDYFMLVRTRDNEFQSAARRAIALSAGCASGEVVHGAQGNSFDACVAGLARVVRCVGGARRFRLPVGI